MFIFVLFVSVTNWEQPRCDPCLSPGVCHIHTMEYYSAIKNNQLLLCVLAQIQLKTLLNEGSQIQKFCFLLIIFDLENRFKTLSKNFGKGESPLWFLRMHLWLLQNPVCGREVKQRLMVERVEDASCGTCQGPCISGTKETAMSAPKHKCSVK